MHEHAYRKGTVTHFLAHTNLMHLHAQECVCVSLETLHMSLRVRHKRLIFLEIFQRLKLFVRHATKEMEKSSEKESPPFEKYICTFLFFINLSKHILQSFDN